MTQIAYTENKTSRFHVGQKIKFKRMDGVVIEDVVRGAFWQHLCLRPWGEDLIYPALTLTDHSWCAEADVEAA